MINYIMQFKTGYGEQAWYLRARFTIPQVLENTYLLCSRDFTGKTRELQILYPEKNHFKVLCQAFFQESRVPLSKQFS